MNRRAEVTLSSMSMPRNCTRAPYLAEAAASIGASVLHGGHQEPHMFTTTGVPRSCDSSSWYRGSVKLGSESAWSGSSGAVAAFTARIVPPSAGDASGDGDDPHEAMASAIATATSETRS